VSPEDGGDPGARGSADEQSDGGRCATDFRTGIFDESRQSRSPL
jgi:hypothetical protein